MLRRMRDSDITGLLEITNYLIRARELSEFSPSNSPNHLPDLTDEDIKGFHDTLVAAQRLCIAMELEHSADVVIWALGEYDRWNRINYAFINQHSDRIYSSLVMETARERFLKISGKRREYFSKLDDPDRKTIFGDQVERAFPSAVPDFVGAGNCFALEQWSASVFHSMRVVERGLIALAIKFNVPHENANWHNIIEGIESKVRALDKNVGTDWKEDQKFFGEAARHLMFLKNAWRNHAMHVRDEYDEGKALSILQHTAELMKHLSARLSESAIPV
jgi:hypothetical protein